MQRTEPVGTLMLVMTRARHVAYLCSWQCTSISVSSPHRFKNACCLFNCVSSTVYHSPYCYTVLNGFWTCPYIYMSALFCLFSSHKFLRLFTFAHPFFLLPFVPPFYFHYSFPLSHLSVHLFHRPQLYSSARFIWCDYLLACFSFRLNPRATSGFLQLIYLLTPPE